MFTSSDVRNWWRFVPMLFLLCVNPAWSVDSTSARQIDLAADWGIQPVHLRITAQGYMIEFRYRVIDEDKALILSDRQNFPSMLSMKSRARFSVPYGSTVGYLKSNRKFLKPGKQYIVMFSNENRHMLPGDQVRIQVKDQITPQLAIAR
jgi:hypothetical protein